MSTKTKTLAKSLHTVSALAAVARHILANPTLEIANADRYGFDKTAMAVKEAAWILGYGHCDDPYGLQEKAVATLKAEGCK